MNKLLHQFKTTFKLFFSLAIIFLISNECFSQVVVLVNPSSPFVIPANVSSVKFEVWGGGGAGGGCASSLGATFGGGGGGGAYNTATITVTSAQSYTLVQGAGGSGVSNANGNPGTASSVTGPSGLIVSANPGGFGQKGGTAGTGGIGAKNGGKGGSGGTLAGGGGAGGAGNTGNGSDGNGILPGLGGTGNPANATYQGGLGGAGGSSANGSSAATTAIAAGGGGGHQIFNGGNRKGGDGGPGRIVITYCGTQPPTVTTPVTYCQGVTAVPLTATGSSLLWYTTPTGGASSSNAPTPSTLSAGTTSYYVSSTNGCESNRAQIDVVVNPRSTITLSSAAGTPNQTLCVNTALTNITYTVGGSATSAALSAGSLPAGVNAAYNAGVFTISGTPSQAGSFNYTVTTSGGLCSQASLSGTITVKSTATIALSSAVGTNNQTVCNNAAINNITYTVGNGATGASVTGLPSGITGSYNAGVFTISGTSSAAAGTYNYIVSTIGGCGTGTANGTITVNDVLSGSFVKTNKSSCNNVNDGTITVTAGGGSGSYAYSWTGNTGIGGHLPFTAGDLSSLTGLDIGFYNVTITDAGGCGSTTINNIHIEYAYSVFVTNSGSNSSSCGNTGSILLYGNAGITPYTYALTPGSGQPTPDVGAFQASNTFTDLAAGDYTAFVKDAGGCVTPKDVSVAAAAPISVSAIARPASSCAADGSIQIFRSGGIPPYGYSIDGINYQGSNLFSSLAAGPYTVYVKDSKNCTASQSVTVTQGAAITVGINKQNTSTCINDGAIQVNASGGISPYTYSINGGAYQPGNTFGGLGATNYTISVKDSKGCEGNAIATINLNPINVTAFATNATSCATSNGKIQLFRTGGYGPYTYSLDGNTYQPGSIFTGLPAGTYDAFVKDSKTCIGFLGSITVGPSGCRQGVAKTVVAENYNSTKINANLTVQSYPNPSDNEFTLRLSGFNVDEKVSISVTDVLGRKVYQSEGIGNYQYRFGSNFKTGIYNVTVIQGNDRRTLQIIKR